MPLEFTTSYLKDSIDLLRYYKRLGERAIAQVPDEALTAALDAESNSIAIIVKHLTGNMRRAGPISLLPMARSLAAIAMRNSKLLRRPAPRF